MHSPTLLHYKHLSKHRHLISHFVSTRKGGVSKDSYATLNIGLHQDDKKENVLENRQRVAKAIGITKEAMVFAEQVHGNRVERIYPQQRGAGSDNHQHAIPRTDAMVTNYQGLCLVTLSADCVSILIFDPVVNAIGVAHAGWQGTVKAIAHETIKALTKEFGSSPKDLLVGIGPAIGPCCYEVGQDVVEEIQSLSIDPNRVLSFKHQKAKPTLNLWRANQLLLIESGVNPDSIETMELCTNCNGHLFYSARAGNRGRFGSGIMIR